MHSILFMTIMMMMMMEIRTTTIKLTVPQNMSLDMFSRFILYTVDPLLPNTEKIWLIISVTNYRE